MKPCESCGANISERRRQCKWCESCAYTRKLDRHRPYSREYQQKRAVLRVKAKRLIEQWAKDCREGDIRPHPFEHLPSDLNEAEFYDFVKTFAEPQPEPAVEPKLRRCEDCDYDISERGDSSTRCVPCACTHRDARRLERQRLSAKEYKRKRAVPGYKPQPEPMRRCRDCGSGIGNRRRNAKRCELCAYKWKLAIQRVARNIKGITPVEAESEPGPDAAVLFKAACLAKRLAKHRDLPLVDMERLVAREQGLPESALTPLRDEARAWL